MMNTRNDTRHDEGHGANAGGPRTGKERRFRGLRGWGLAAAVLILGAAPGDRVWAVAGWTVGQRAVTAAAVKTTVPPELALAVAQVSREQRLRGEGEPGAVGIMQVLPSLAREELGIRAYGLDDARASAGVSVALLERLNRRYDGRWDLTLSHYRRGPLLRCKEGPVMHDGTLPYVAAVMDWWVRYQKDPAVAALVEEARRGGLSGAGVKSRTEGRGWAAGRDGRRRGGRRFGESRAWTRGNECNGSARGWRPFRSDDGPGCDGVRSPRFF